MARYIATIRTPWDPEKAFDYMADVTNFEKWDPGVKSSDQVSGSDPGVGAEYDVSVTGSTLRYRTEEFDRPRTTLLRASTRLLTSVDRITVEPDPGTGGATVTYDADLTLNGPLKLADPFLKLLFDRIGDRAARGMAEALEGTLQS